MYTKIKYEIIHPKTLIQIKRKIMKSVLKVVLVFVFILSLLSCEKEEQCRCRTFVFNDIPVDLYACDDFVEFRDGDSYTEALERCKK